jgi:hypothetical protein
MVEQPRSHEPADLLLKALDGLEPAERDVVLKALLTGTVGMCPAPSVFLSDPPAPLNVPQGSPPPGQPNQPLVIRLPTELHSRLRKWSTNNGFTMAAVTRGLIERFLEGRA